MLRKLSAVGVAVATLLASQAAQAQDKGQFGEQGQFIFGADRLFALFAYTNNQYGEPGGTVTLQGTSMSFLGGVSSVAGGTGNGNNFGAGNPTFYSAPRVGFDYTVIPKLTIGGELFAWFALGGSESTPNGGGTTVSVSSPTGNEFGIAPRVGYIIGLNDILSIWLRGGLHYYIANVSLPPGYGLNGNASCNASANLDVFGLDLDPQLVISPVNHFAFTAGPALDFGFSGGYNVTEYTNNGCSRSVNTSGNYNSLNFSINGGIIGWL